MNIPLILGVLIAIWFVYNLYKMIHNAAQGKSLDGCDGNCAHCSGHCCYSRKDGEKKGLNNV